MRPSSSLFFPSILLSLAACGGRTALGDADDADARMGPDVRDVPGAHAEVDAAAHAEPDAASRGDADAGADADAHADSALTDAAADADALPPIDASTSDADLTGCTPGTTAAYVISTENLLYRFDPDTLTTTFVGTPACAGASSAYTMTASRSGTLYALYTDWKVHAIDPLTLSCTLTPFADGQLGFPGNVGIAIARAAGEERFFVAGYQSGDHVLASGDLTTFTLSRIGTISPKPAGYPLDMQADAYNRLWALPSSGELVLVDPATAEVLGRDSIPGFATNGTWAILTWGRDVYVFGGTTASSSKVYRYDPNAKAVTATATVGVLVVGATSTPCVP